MLLVLHILVAISGLLAASLAAILPSSRKLHATYMFSVATVVSGAALVIVLHASVTQTCTTGVTYLAVTGLLSTIGRYRLARQT